ncbi:MAG: hypothetical protein IKP64_11120 [Selenomonadaceae bacterium]|nr:hypothetical protein [Selenomonadaceae bacterium]MBR4384093.1 hypothetical protein [Selenomonadaceae bacterium]
MKKFFAMLLVVGSLFFSSTVNAEIKTYVVEGSATLSETETQEQITKRATTSALKNAQEQVGNFVRDFAKTQGYEFTDDQIETLVIGVIKITDSKVTNSVSEDGTTQIHVTLTAQIDTDELEREIDGFVKTPTGEVVEPIKTYTQESRTTISGSETHDQTLARATDYAIKEIRRQLDIDIRVFARARKIELTNSEVNSIAAKVMKITEKTVNQSLFESTIEVRVKVTVQVDPADLKREIEKLARTGQPE